MCSLRRFVWMKIFLIFYIRRHYNILPAPANYSPPQQPGPGLQVHQAQEKDDFSCLLQKECTSIIYPPVRRSKDRDWDDNLLIDPDTDPLEWWKRHQQIFPRLSSLAKKIPLGPSNEFALRERFSVGGGIVTCHRAEPEVVDTLVFLAKNVYKKWKDVQIKNSTTNKHFIFSCTDI